MHLTEAENQRYFDEHKHREKICAQWLKSQTKTVRSTVMLASTAGIINGLGIMAQAALFAFLLDSIIFTQPNWQDLITPLLALSAVFTIRSLAVYWQQTSGFEAGAKIKTQLRAQLAERFAQLDSATLKQQQSGALATLALEQVEALEPYFSRYLPQQTIAGVLPVLMIAVVMPFNWVVGLILLFTAPLVPLFMALIGMGAAAAQRSQFLAMSRMSGYFLDRLQGLPTLKLFGQAEQEVENINRIADNFRQTTMSVLRIAFMSSAVLEFFSAVAVALVAVYTGLSLLGFIHFGPENVSFRLALFVLLLAPEFFNPLRQLAVFYHDRAAALGAADLLIPYLTNVPTQALIPTKQSPSNYLLEFRQVGKSYGQRTVLTDINFTVNRGEKCALVGASGAGKSTLCHLLLGFESASTGQIYLNGQPLTQALATQAIAWGGQQAHIFCGSIIDNITLGNPLASTLEITAAAQAAGVTEFSVRLPDGLQTQIGERGFGLSGGQVQRILLARVFLKNTDIVLLDEPTASLDATNKKLLLDTIATLFKDKTVIIASHDAEVIARMDRQLVLQQGRLL
jgi:ATP-binding cassette subfamily C protein CydD